MNYQPHAHLLCMGPEYALKRYSGSTRSLPPEGADAFLGAARRPKEVPRPAGSPLGGLGDWGIGGREAP